MQAFGQLLGFNVGYHISKMIDSHNFALDFALFGKPGTETVKTSYLLQIYFRAQFVHLQTVGDMGTNRRYDIPAVECLTYRVPEIVRICYKV